MAQPKADGRDVYETEEALGRFVITGCNAACVLERIEAPLDQVTQGIQRMIDAGAHLA